MQYSINYHISFSNESERGVGRILRHIVEDEIVGYVSGYVGAAVAASEIPMANTLGIMASSFTYSLGTNMYTGGQTDISISLGVASYNLKLWLLSLIRR